MSSGSVGEPVDAPSEKRTPLAATSATSSITAVSTETARVLGTHSASAAIVASSRAALAASTRRSRGANGEAARLLAVRSSDSSCGSTSGALTTPVIGRRSAEDEPRGSSVRPVCCTRAPDRPMDSRIDRNPGKGTRS